jgi:hypothetical protein
VTINIFTKANTDAWQAHYEYNFAALGLPGLTFMTRYVDGSHAQCHPALKQRPDQRHRRKPSHHRLQPGFVVMRGEV